MHLRLCCKAARLAFAGLLAACAVTGFSQSAQITSPAAGTALTPGTDVTIGYSVTGFNFGIHTITITGQGDPFGSTVYTFPYSPPTNSDSYTAIYTVPTTGVTPGQTLTVSISAQGWVDESANGSRNFIVAGTPAPGNDAFANATSISGDSGTITGTNAGATKETGEPSHAGNAGGKSIWYKWVATFSQTAVITTAGSAFDTLLGVYTGSSVSALSTVAQNDDEGGGLTTSRLTFTPVSGTTYYIAIDGKGGASGSTTLHWQSLNPILAADVDWCLYD